MGPQPDPRPARVGAGHVTASCAPPARAAGTPRPRRAPGGQARRLVAGLAVLGLLAACGPTTTPGPKAEPTQPTTATTASRPAPVIPQGPVTLALLLPLSGPAAGAGARLKTAALRMAAGDPAVNLMTFDTQSTPDGARAAAAAALAARAQMVIGPLYGTNARTVGPILAQAGVPVLALTNTSAAAGPGLSILGHAPGPQVERVLTHAATTGARRVIVTGPDTAYARLALETARSLAPLGVTVTAVDLYPPGLSYDAVAERVRALARQPGDLVLVPAAGLDLVGLSSLFQYYGGRGAKRLVGTNLWEGTRALEREVSLRRAWFTAPHPALSPMGHSEAGAGTEDAATRAEAGAEGSGGAGAGAGVEPPAMPDAARAALGTDPIPAPPDYDAPDPVANPLAPRPPDAVEALVMDAVAVARAWANQTPRAQPLAAFLRQPRGFQGASGAFRLTDDGITQRLYAVLEITRTGFVTVDPPPDRFPAATADPLPLDQRSLPPSSAPGS